jgi:hypothetical protein
VASWAKRVDRQALRGSLCDCGFAAPLSVNRINDVIAHRGPRFRAKKCSYIEYTGAAMTTARADLKTLWQARLRLFPRDVEVPADADISKELDTAEASAATVELLRVWSCFVEIFRPGCGRVLFRVNRTKSGGITFSDSWDCQTGIAGTTGLWGTRPPLRIPRPRSLTPNAFKLEAARLVGKERAEQILLEIKQDEFFSSNLRQM